MKKLFPFLFIVAAILTGCTDEPTPTRDLMEGVWELTEAYDEDDSLITDRINGLFPTYVHLDDNNSVNSTAGPMFMYIVYGKSNFVNVASKLDQAFSYADLKFTEGEYFMKKDEVVDRFTIEMKMKFLTLESLTTILELMNINPPSFIEEVIYHKFIDVNVIIDDENDQVMEWAWDSSTQPTYNIKDEYGNPVLWYGIPWESFTKGRFVFQKKVKSLTELANEAGGG
ncbi:MAG: hypothetical protein MRY83_15130 [Flavobacteriales bacterium]|nr:hypothetical protein [Flavobacteriales bacterium]